MGLSSSVYELVEDHRGDAFHTLRMGDAVHVLYAFEKKSKSSVATLQPDVAFGVPPHRYLLTRRIERATALRHVDAGFRYPSGNGWKMIEVRR
jgi:phage-related protein